MTIRIDDELVITGDMRNPALCLRAVFPSCSGLTQAPVSLRRQDIEIFRGDDLQVTYSVVDERGLPVAINTSQNLKWWVGRTINGPVVLQKERQNGGILFSGGIILLGDDFRLRLQIDAVDTENLAPGRYYWELQIGTDNLKTSTIGFGNFIIRPDLINDTNEPV